MNGNDKDGAGGGCIGERCALLSAGAGVGMRRAGVACNLQHLCEAITA